LPKSPINKSKYHSKDKLNKNTKAPLNKKKFKDDAQSNLLSVSIIVCTMRQSCMKNVFDNYSRQNYNNKEMIIVLNNNKMDLSKWQKQSNLYKNVKVFQLDEKITLGTCMNYGISQSSHDVIAKFDDDDYYGPKYLLDSVKAFQRHDADVIAKRKRIEVTKNYFFFRSSSIIFRY